MATPVPGAEPSGGEHHLRRAVGLRALTMISIGSIIGSGWLLGALTAAKVAGAASLVSWVLGGLVLALLALVHAEDQESAERAAEAVRAAYTLGDARPSIPDPVIEVQRTV